MRVSFPVFPGVRVSGSAGNPKGCMVFLTCVVLLGLAVQHWHGLVRILTGVAVVGLLLVVSKPRPDRPRKRSKHRA